MKRKKTVLQENFDVNDKFSPNDKFWLFLT